ncbi:MULTISPECIES: hypothetical protein [unclassified Spirosoma]|uniref:hypothetical protein n=1 Tax=unclassified Spirosoma TaxID=2621999 RepID=UPI000965CB33|nr:MULTISPECIES: hypothetical protein [unclassified Spirosoma]MBN8823876.1 hypothetical protein [Spirosoma sp.]OJW79733.1 MAG: hypothetical protein BGO59_00320 [Spirosoma sp. 48-14]
MIADLEKAGIFRQITTENRPTLVLAAPLLITITPAVLKSLHKAYPKSSEIGGVLFTYPDAQARTLRITKWVQLPNLLDDPRKAYATSKAALSSALSDCINSGALPITFHTHPVTGTGDTAYDSQGIKFYDRTSSADRHNSYLPITIEGRTVVMPSALLVGDDKDATSTHISLYSGFIAPMSLRALRDAEKYYLFVAGGILLILFALGKVGRHAALYCLLLACVVFYIEERKRPRYSNDADGNLLILLP